MATNLMEGFGTVTGGGDEEEKSKAAFADRIAPAPGAITLRRICGLILDTTLWIPKQEAEEKSQTGEPRDERPARTRDGKMEGGRSDHYLARSFFHPRHRIWPRSASRSGRNRAPPWHRVSTSASPYSVRSTGF